MPIVQYHATVLRESGLAPNFSRIEDVHAREKMSGFRFPASIVEWYSLKDAVELLENFREGNADSRGKIVPITSLGDPGPHDPETPYRGYLQLYRSGEADFAIYAILNGSEDPAVYVDACKLDDEDLLIPKFFPYKPTYSEFVLDWVRRGSNRGVEPT